MPDPLFFLLNHPLIRRRDIGGPVGRQLRRLRLKQRGGGDSGIGNLSPRYYAAMPRPLDERQALEQERADLPGQIAAHQAELAATMLYRVPDLRSRAADGLVRSVSARCMRRSAAARESTTSTLSSIRVRRPRSGSDDVVRTPS